ncbi:MAG: YIP1 family protein [Candidatus Heimdallarchaeota archaeon]|nr:YIP1 family protein [Candidatus Heimdallarchaeota archaeon]
MSDEHLKFCDGCGHGYESVELFCPSCGKNLEQREDRTEFSINQPELRQPIMMLQNEYWRGNSLFDASKQMLTNPKSASRAILQDPRSPNPIPVVFLYAVITSLIAIITTTKITEVTFDSDVPELYQSSLESQAGFSAINLVVSIFTIIIGWYIVSWILGAIFKGGFPPSSPLRYDINLAMRKLNAYRYIPLIITGSIQLILLLLQPDQSVHYSMQTIPFFGLLPIPTYSGFSSVYYLLSDILMLVALGYSLYMLYIGISSNNYSGSWLIVVIAFNILFNIWPIIQNIIF